MSKLTISVVIPVHNGGQAFHRCLEHLLRAAPPPDEIIVVADGAADESVSRAKELGIRVLSTGVRSGPARARNIGARAARGDIIFFVDADVALPPDAIRQVATTFARDPELAALFGSYDDAPAAPNFLSQYKNLFHHYVHQTAREEASTFWGACGAIRRTLFLRVGGFDERYRQPAIEDIELGYRLKRAGERVRLCKSLQVKHLKRWEASSLLRSDFFDRALPWSELILRDGRFIDDLNVGTSARANVMMAYALGAVLLGSWRQRWLGLPAGLLLVALLAANAPLYKFFWQKRGLRFTLQVIPWHWLYFLYSGAAFALASARTLLASGASDEITSARAGERAGSPIRPGLG